MGTIDFGATAPASLGAWKYVPAENGCVLYLYWAEGSVKAESVASVAEAVIRTSHLMNRSVAGNQQAAEPVRLTTYRLLDDAGGLWTRAGQIFSQRASGPITLKLGATEADGSAASGCATMARFRSSELAAAALETRCAV